MKTLILARHAMYDSSNGRISDFGKEQAACLAEAIAEHIDRSSAVLWSSSAPRAVDTAEVIQQQLQTPLRVEDKLWSDSSRLPDFDWLKKQIDAFEGEALVIVTHLEYVEDFPCSKLGVEPLPVRYAQAVLIEGGNAQIIDWDR